MVKSEQVKITVYFRKVKQFPGGQRLLPASMYKSKEHHTCCFRSKWARQNKPEKTPQAELTLHRVLDSHGHLWTLIEEAGMYDRWSIPSPHPVLHSLETSVSMWTLRWWGEWGRSTLGLFFHHLTQSSAYHRGAIYSRWRWCGLPKRLTSPQLTTAEGREEKGRGC